MRCGYCTASKTQNSNLNSYNEEISIRFKAVSPPEAGKPPQIFVIAFVQKGIVIYDQEQL